jgi:hypothetical protein
MWSQRLQSRPISSLSNLRFPHNAHLLILFTSGLPLLGNLSVDSWTDKDARVSVSWPVLGPILARVSTELRARRVEIEPLIAVILAV